MLLGAKIYWARPTAHRVQRSNKDGTALETIYIDAADGGMPTGPSGVAVDAAEVYWTDVTNYKVSRCGNAPNCVTPTTFATASGTATPVVMDATTVYWATNNSLLKLDRSAAGGMPVVMSNTVAPAGIALDADYVYVTDSTSNNVLRFCKADSSMTTIAVNQASPRGIAVDTSVTPSVIYWASHGNGNIVSATTP
jgi:hypothetical protein